MPPWNGRRKTRETPNDSAFTGFCWGGRITWLYAAHSPKVKAGVAWYGRLIGDSTPLQPKNPIDIVPALKAPVLGLYGGQDQGIPLDTVEKMREALKKAGKTSDIIVYPDAPPGCFADVRDSYRKEAAQDGWKRLLAWFKNTERDKLRIASDGLRIPAKRPVSVLIFNS
jgi:carboxymethylenebutenolidase